jgi:general secretion pathway protein B
MSFILDALKKSENDRQRQSGPALFEVRVAPPRAGFPTWAYALLALLAVNLGVVGWLMLRRPAAAATPPMEAATTAPAPAAVGPAPVQAAPMAQPPVAQMAPPPGAYAPPNGQQYPQQAPPGQQQYPQQGYQPNYPQQNYPQQNYPQQQTFPPQQQNYQQQQGYAPPAQEPRLSQNAGGYGAPPPQQQQQAPPQGGNPDDYAPAAEPSGGAPLGRVRRGLENGLMTYEEAATKNTIPPLHMDLHVYAPDPNKRFVLVNAKRLGEGQSLPEGVRVDSITTDGAILSYRGVQFMMERD